MFCGCFTVKFTIQLEVICTIHSLFFIRMLTVFPAQAEYSYFSADFRLKIFLYYSQIIAYDISVVECTGVSVTSVLRCLKLVQVFSFCWLVLPFRERNNFIRLSISLSKSQLRVYS